ncbi:MAG: tripartite tricarboxylate transporter TctB family protein [Oscillospiraceae bacterium]|nr:tripartite tricarboxylate transporter TctB family protein [Oscillospiraceae bacterium]
MRDHLNNKTAREGLAVLTAGLALGVYSIISLRRSAVQTAWILSPWLFPMLLAVFAAALGAALLGGGCRETAESRNAGKPDARGALRVLAAALMVAAYCALLPLLHFLPASALFLAGMMLFLGERRWWSIAAVAVAAPLVLYALFALGLGVRLP